MSRCLAIIMDFLYPHTVHEGYDEISNTHLSINFYVGLLSTTFVDNLNIISFQRPTTHVVNSRAFYGVSKLHIVYRNDCLKRTYLAIRAVLNIYELLPE